ncbi:hypothetical protein TNCV_1516911 [Trichonephila clavipes]|nr:hypothetical protein TNCV_1516911 [Trichonephila clavipes]
MLRNSWEQYCGSKWVAYKGFKQRARAPDDILIAMERNPRLSMREIARDLGISYRLVRRIAKTELGMKPCKLRKVQLLTEKTNSYGSEDAENF